MTVQPVLGAEIVLNTAAQEPFHTPDQTGLIDQLLHEAFSRAGISVTIRYRPAERALVNANQGLADGDAFRVSGLSAKYKNLVKLTENIYTASFSVFSKHETRLKNGWKNLNGYRVGIIRGHKILEDSSIGGDVIYVPQEESLFKMLAADRLDYALINTLRGSAIIRKYDLVEITQNIPALFTQDMYVYLHKKNIEIVPTIDLVLKKMKEDGTYMRIVKRALVNDIGVQYKTIQLINNIHGPDI